MKTKKLFVIFSTAVCMVYVMFCAIFAPVSSTFNVFASSGQSKTYADTQVMEDLENATIGDIPFDIRNYPVKSGESVQVIHFVEYGYCFFPDLQVDFGLYIYVYNPGLWNLKTESQANRLQIATLYHTNGEPAFYEKFSLKFLSKSTGDLDGLFYKFKVQLSNDEKESLLSRLDRIERRYDLSGVELSIGSSLTPYDFKITRTYFYSGFAKGYGVNEEFDSTLICSIRGMEMVSLNVNQTWYRTETSTKGLGWQHQINSVYFSVPNKLLNDYGNLQKILAEWWEYQTQPIYVTKNADLYNKYTPIVGQRTIKNNSLKYGIYTGFSGGGSTPLTATWGFNDIGNFIKNGGTLEEYIYYLFKVNDIEKYSNSELPKGGVSSEQLLNYIMSYDKSFNNGYLPVKDNQISADLFTNTIDQSRLESGIKRGYNLIEIDAGDTQDLKFYDGVSQNNAWDWFWSGGVKYVFGSLLQREVRPIEQLPATFPTGTDTQISDQYFVNLADVSELRNFHATAKQKDETVFLFHFAVTDYKCDWLTIYDDKNPAWWEYIFGWIVSQNRTYEGELYKAQQTLFFNFDIIQLTFEGDFGQTVIPVVSNPIDIIPDITPPTYDPPLDIDYTDWLKLILALLIGIILFVILMPLIPTIIQVLVFLIRTIFNIILLPFRVLKKTIKKQKKRGENEKT